MDALIAKADALRTHGKKRKSGGAGPSQSKRLDPKDDYTVQSISKNTSLPKSLRLQDSESSKKYGHIANKKLRVELDRTSAHNARSKALLEDADMLLEEEAGGMEVEGPMDRTWRIGQSEITSEAGQEAAKGRKEWKLEGGPYKARYTRNGRFVFQ